MTEPEVSLHNPQDPAKRYKAIQVGGQVLVAGPQTRPPMEREEAIVYRAQQLYDGVEGCVDMSHVQDVVRANMTVGQ